MTHFREMLGIALHSMWAGRLRTVLTMVGIVRRQLLQGLGLEGEQLPTQMDPAGLPILRKRFATAIATKSRDEWAEHFADLNACARRDFGSAHQRYLCFHESPPMLLAGHLRPSDRSEIDLLITSTGDDTAVNE